MHEKNTMTQNEYFMTNAFWFLYVAVCYNRILFRAVPGCYIKRSGFILCILVIVIMTLGFALTFTGHRTRIAVFVNVVLPFELYSLLVFHEAYPVLAAVSIGITLLYMALYMYYSGLRPLHGKRHKWQIILRRFRNGLRKFMTAAAFCMLILFIPVIVGTAFDRDSAQNANNGVASAESTAEENMDILENLYQSDWYEIDRDEKLGILQTVVDTECDYLGIPYKLYVAVDTLDCATTAAYNESIHTVVLNWMFLDSVDAEEILNSVCHECRHAYQYCLCDAYDSVKDKYKNLLSVREIQLFQDEFNNYINGRDSYSAYYEQKCETDARTYAEERTEYYFEELSNKNETKDE